MIFPLTLTFLVIFTAIGFYLIRDRKKVSGTIEINKVIEKLLSLGFWSANLRVLNGDMEFIIIDSSTTLITSTIVWNSELKYVLITVYLMVMLYSILTVYKELLH